MSNWPNNTALLQCVMVTMCVCLFLTDTQKNLVPKDDLCHGLTSPGQGTCLFVFVCVSFCVSSSPCLPPCVCVYVFDGTTLLQKPGSSSALCFSTPANNQCSPAAVNYLPFETNTSTSVSAGSLS